MHDQQEIPAYVRDGDGVRAFLVPTCLYRLQEGSEDRPRRLLRRNAGFSQTG
jgi:hypothetical protein